MPSISTVTATRGCERGSRRGNARGIDGVGSGWRRPFAAGAPSTADDKPREGVTQQAGTRLGLVLMATLFGMALGGWMSGAI